jgi:beta-phosphoglucomutase
MGSSSGYEKLMIKSLPLNNYKNILFDFDGVLGKTMEDNYKAWAHSLAPYEIQVERKEYFLMEGAPPKKVAEFFLKKKRLGLEFVDDIVRSKETYYLENRNFSLYEGAKELVEALKADGIKLGLVTGASHERLMSTNISSFINLFDTLVTGDQITHGKPDPEPYFQGASKLQALPSECLVIENAPFGIESAKKAGMYCIAICSTLSKEHLTNADEVVNSIDELQSLLSKKFL